MAHLRKALAMATLCFSPPLNLRPRSPTIVEYPAQERAMSQGSAARHLLR